MPLTTKHNHRSCGRNKGHNDVDDSSTPCPILIRDGTICSGIDKASDHSAVAVVGAVITASDYDGFEWATIAGPEVVDLTGGFLMPAFGEGHAHPLFTADTIKLTADTIKLFADGVVKNTTADPLEPYLSDPHRQRAIALGPIRPPHDPVRASALRQRDRPLKIFRSAGGPPRRNSP